MTIRGRSHRHVGQALGPRRYTYNVRLVRRTLSYTVQEIAELFTLHPNAVRRWLKAGLRVIDDKRPYLVHGSDLVDFLSRRQEGRRRRCEPGEIYCCRCRAPRRPAAGSVVIERVNTTHVMVRGCCELCGARMNRFGLLARLSDIRRVFTITASPPRIDETADPALMCDLSKESGRAAIQSQE